MSVVIIAKRTNHVMKKTEELLKTIQSCKNYQDFISESRQELISVRKLGEAFQEILTQKKLKKSDVIRNSGIDRGYAYDIKNSLPATKCFCYAWEPLSLLRKYRPF